MKLKLAVGVVMLCGMSASANAATTATFNLGGLTTPGSNLIGIGEVVLEPILTDGPAMLGPVVSVLIPQSTTGLFGIAPLFGLIGNFAPLANPLFSLLGSLAGGAALIPALPALPGLSE